MELEDKIFCIQRYTERYKNHGYDPQSLGWGKNGKQEIRFNILSEIGINKKSSVLDIGCGFGDLRRYLLQLGWAGKYVGLDLVDSFLFEAKLQQKDIDVRNIDILNDDFSKQFDYVVASGIFNAKMKAQANYDYIREMLKKMHSLAYQGVAVDFLSKYVDFEQELNFHSDPSVIIEIAESISKRMIIRHDYMPYEFTLYLFKDNSIIPEKHIYTSFLNNHV